MADVTTTSLEHFLGGRIPAYTRCVFSWIHYLVTRVYYCLFHLCLPLLYERHYDHISAIFDQNGFDDEWDLFVSGLINQWTLSNLLCGLLLSSVNCTLF